jgi:anaerobic selenocysteine-containing dehydrogenase
VEPAGEARPNHEVFADLCRRTGVARPGDPETADALVEAILATSPRAAEIRRDLDAQGYAVPGEGAAPVQFVDSFPRTADRRVHLVPEELDREAPLGLYHFQPEGKIREYPLALISPASDQTISSSLGELRRERVPLSMHPDDAVDRGLGDEDSVRVFNALGEVQCRVRLDRPCGPAWSCCPRGSGGTTPRAARRPRPSRPRP